MRFSLREAERSVEITIEDNGPGLPANRRAAISELNGTSGSQDGGSGLGLTIVRDIIHAHGGSIRLMDSPLGGLAILLSLPK